MVDLSQTVARPEARKALDDQLSQRFIALDPAGYFLIKLDRETAELVVEHYRNDVDERGLATDPETGEVLSCRGSGPRQLSTSPVSGSVASPRSSTSLR